MWIDPKTKATYTDAQRNTMQGNPVYKKLLARLVQSEQVPEPKAAATKEVKQKKDDSTNGATTE